MTATAASFDHAASKQRQQTARLAADHLAAGATFSIGARRPRQDANVGSGERSLVVAAGSVDARAAAGRFDADAGIAGLPALLERTAQLDQLHSYLRQAAAGEGRMVLVGGEAGIGKTALIERFVREAQPAVPSARAEIVSCDGLKMPGPLGPLFEIAQVLGPDVERLLAEEAPRDRLFRAVFGAMSQAPVPLLLVGEDAHWTDEASLELIRFLGQRVGRLRALFVVTYRDDELGPYHPLRRVLGDLATAPAVRRMTLPPFSPAAVTELARGSGIDPVELHARTGGNPFFVTEVLAAGTHEVPATVRDAVLARASRLSPEARAVLDAAAVIGMIIDPDLLEAVIGGPVADAVEECLAAGMLRHHERKLAMRHGLGRNAILGSISPPRHRALHRRILAAMQTDAAFRRDLAHVAHHAEEAGDQEVVLNVAPAAARQAAAFGAHREAAAQYARAIRFAADLPEERRAELLEARGRECYLTGEVENAVAACREALALWRGIGDRIRQGGCLVLLSRMAWFAGRNPEAEELAAEALALLEPLSSGPELARAYSNVSQLRMMADDFPAAIDLGERAIALASELGEQETLSHALNSVGTARLLQDEESGRALLERSLKIAQEAGRDYDVARALANLASSAFSRHRLDETERYVIEGLRYTGERDLLAMERYLRTQRIQLLFARGDWDAAIAEAEATVRDLAASSMTRMVALISLGRLRACRGEDGWAILDEVLSQAEATGELQRLGPLRIARAEAAWLAGDNERAAYEASRGLELAVPRGNRWMASGLAIWLRRAGHEAPVSMEVVEPYALELTGNWAAAAAQWDGLGFPLEAARARSEGGDEDALRAAIATFEVLGAKPDAARAIGRLRELGARIPRGPRESTRGNPGLLTEREIEVLGLLVAGTSNRDIAESLYVSSKTVAHHVSAILAKLGVVSRGEAAAEALRMGLVSGQDGHTHAPI